MLRNIGEGGFRGLAFINLIVKNYLHFLNSEV